MAHDIFISYSIKDKPSADAVCSILEANHLRCWIAPRDINPGTPFAEAIIDGIKDSKVFILIFSSHSNRSPQVMREVERAVHHGLPIIPLRIEDVPMSKQLEYYVSDVHWLDAITPPLENHINKLCKVVQLILSMSKMEDKDIKEMLVTETEKTTESQTKDKRAEHRLSDEDTIERKISILENGKTPEKRIASNDSTGRYSLKKYFIAALIVVTIIAIVIVHWLFTDKTESIISAADYVEAGNEFLENMDYDEALNQFDKALAEDPAIYEARIGIATVLFRQEKLEEAITELQKAIDLDEQDPYAYKIMGEIFKQKEEFDKAMFYFQKYLWIAPDSPDSEEVNRIIRTMEEQLRPPVIPEKPVTKPDEIEVYDYSTKVQTAIDDFNQGRYNQCIRQMEEILNVEPDNIYARYYLAEATKKIEIEIKTNYESALEAFEKENYRECIRQFEKVLQLDPENIQSKTYLDLAKTNLYSQQIGMVVHQYVRAVENNILLDFYEKKCSPLMYEQIKDDVQLISRLYSNIHATVLDHSIRFIEMERAEVTIIFLMTGVSNDEERRQVIFEGKQVWNMVMEGEEWNIDEIKFIAT